jgi:hypothetical protein
MSPAPAGSVTMPDYSSTPGYTPTFTYYTQPDRTDRVLALLERQMGVIEALVERLPYPVMELPALQEDAE